MLPTLPPNGKRKVIDSKVPTGRGYVIVPWMVFQALASSFGFSSVTCFEPGPLDSLMETA